MTNTNPFEIDARRAPFRRLIEQTISDQHDPQLKVWMLIENGGTGVSIHIFHENPCRGVSFSEEAPSGWGQRIKHWFIHVVPWRTSKNDSILTVPYIPYPTALVGIQICVQKNAIESIIWQPVPDDNDFGEGTDIPENPRIEVLVPDLAAYLTDLQLNFKQRSSHMNEQWEDGEVESGYDDSPF